MEKQMSFVQALDDATNKLLYEGPRGHMGASQIGGRCALQTWLGFRWAGQSDPGGRVRRLWERGHQEEHRIVRWLRAMGVEVRDYQQRLMYHHGSDCYVCIDWDNMSDPCWMDCDDVSNDPLHIRRATEREEGPRQWDFQDHNGHYAGSGDGQVGQELAMWFPEVAGKGWGLLECKTHNEKSFNELRKKKVQLSKPVHYIQMQQYMHYFGLKWAFYVAVNKNTDEVYPEIVWYREEVAKPYADRADKVIGCRRAPVRLTDDPTWFECRYCDFRRQCHYDEPLQNKCCRSCIFASPEAGKTWYCNKHKQEIPEEFWGQKCSLWESCL